MSLDVPEKQILVYFPNDNVAWHHRLLIVPIKEAVWVVATPDFDVEVMNLAGMNIRALGRNVAFPAGLGQVYGFDNPIEAANLANVRAAGRRLAEVMGAPPAAIPGAAPARAANWRYADSAHDKFGSVVDQDLIGQPERVHYAGSSALLDEDGSGDWTFLQKVADEDLEEWHDEKRAGASRDARLGPSNRDVDGVRRATLKEVLPELKRGLDNTLKGFPCPGPRVGPDFLTGVVATGHECLAYADHYKGTSGMNDKSGLAVEFTVLVAILHMLISLDQLNPANLASAELLMRRVRMIQKAVKRNPKVPDFEGLEVHLSHLLDARGGIVTTAYDRHIAEEQKAEAITLKQTRLWRDEQEADAKRKSGKPAAGSASDQK